MVIEVGMNEDNLSKGLRNLVEQINNATGKVSIWEELAERLKDYTQVRITLGEDNTFALPYYVKIQDGLGLDSTENWYEIVQWCHRQFGPRWHIDNNRGVWCSESNGTYHFKTEADRILFMLKWAQ